MDWNRKHLQSTERSTLEGNLSSAVVLPGFGQQEVKSCKFNKVFTRETFTVQKLQEKHVGKPDNGGNFSTK